MLQLSVNWLETQMNLIKTTALSPTLGVIVHLAQTPFTPTPSSDPSTYTEASYTGYTTQHVATWGPAHVDSAGNILCNGLTLPNFVPSGVLITPQTVGGYWIVDELGAYLGGEAFTAPITITGPTTPVTFTVGVPIRTGTFNTDILP